jgi:hypothetical protein
MLDLAFDLQPDISVVMLDTMRRLLALLYRFDPVRVESLP